MSKYYYKRKRKEDEIFECVKVYVPKGIAEYLKRKRDLSGIPLSRLVAIAVDNELDAPNPFNYPTDLPDNVVEYMYAGEAKKILDFMFKVPRGIAVDSLLLCRRDIGIEDRKSVLAGLKELMNQNVVVEFMDQGKTLLKTNGLDRMVKKARRLKRVEDEPLKYARRIMDDDVEEIDEDGY